MSPLRIDLDGDRRWFLPGETLGGRVTWRLTSPPEAVELRLFWFTSGKGSEDIEIVASVRTEAVDAVGDRSFSFPLPLDPYSFSGSLITLAWALELLAPPTTELSRVDLVVSPTPVEVRLASLGREPRGYSPSFGRRPDRRGLGT